MVHGFQSNSSSFAAPHEFLQRILEFNRSQNWFTQQRLHKNPLSAMIERHGFLMFLAICPKISLKPSHFLHILLAGVDLLLAPDGYASAVGSGGLALQTGA